jgi:pyruvate dehydrogenase kinase 2/3/4
MKEITLLPEGLLRMPSVKLVSNWYARSFQEVIEFEKTDPCDKNLEK